MPAALIPILPAPLSLFLWKIQLNLVTVRQMHCVYLLTVIRSLVNGRFLRKRKISRFFSSLPVGII